MTSLLLAEDLLLLCTDDDSGRCVIDRDSLDRALALALVFEMTIRGLAVQDPETNSLGAVAGAVAADPLLALCVETVDEGSPVEAVDRLRNTQPRKAISARLLARGVLRAEGLWSRARHPQQNPQPEIVLRGRLRGIVLHHDEPSEHDLALVALIDHLQIARGVFPHEDAEHIESAVHRVAQGWAEVIHHPQTFTGGRKRSRFHAALDLLDVVFAPLDLLDGL